MAEAARGTAGIRVREEAEAAAFTSTSLRERWRELGGGAVGGALVGGALAGGGDGAPVNSALVALALFHV